MYSGARTMKLQVSFCLEALITLITMMYSAGSDWRWIPEIRVLRGKMNIETS